MSPITHRIQSFRKLRDKYTRLRTRAICERDKTIAHRTAGWVLNHQELKEMLQGLEDGTIMRSIEPSDWCGDDSGWETVDTGVDRTEMDTNFEQNNGAGGKDEAEAAAGTITVTEVVDTYVTESEGDFKMDWESTISGNFERVFRESEDIADAALGEGLELSDLLQLEKEQPDDISNLEAPTRPTSPKQDNTPPTSNRLSIDFKYFDWDDEDNDDCDEFPATEFFHTDTAISDAEWALESLEPFKKYRAKTPTLLRACYTVIV
ncbi:hypothetical protein V8E51_014310 [Hyaloscypha variabilis]